MYRRQVDEVIGGYDESLFLSEDYDFWLRAYCHFGFQPIQEYLYGYRVHESSLSATRASQAHQAKTRAVAKNLPLLRKRAPQVAARICIVLSHRAAERKSRSEARLHIARALWCSPTSVLRYGRQDLVVALLGDRFAEAVGRGYQACRGLTP